MSRDKLKDLRHEIDRIDRQLLELLNERIDVSIHIGAVKLASGRQVFAPGREEEVLQRLEQLNPGPMDREALRAIYREIINSSVAVQAKLAIGYVGRRGSQIAMVAANRFGPSHSYRGFDAIAKLWAALEAGRIEVGVVARTRLVPYALEHGKLPWPVCSELGGPEEKSGESLRYPYYVISRSEGQGAKHGRTVFWLETDSAEMCVKNVKSLLQMEKLKLLRSEGVPQRRSGRDLCQQIEVSGDVSESQLRQLIEKLPQGLVSRWCRLGCFS